MVVFYQKPRRLSNIPELFKDEVFTHAFQVAELAKMDREDWERYEYSLKVFRDNKATYDYAVETAREEGLQKGIWKKVSKRDFQEGIQEGLKEGQRNIARS
jgi:hypothetical protein